MITGQARLILADIGRYCLMISRSRLKFDSARWMAATCEFCAVGEEEGRVSKVSKIRIFVERCLSRYGRGSIEFFFLSLGGRSWEIVDVIIKRRLLEIVFVSALRLSLLFTMENCGNQQISIEIKDCAYIETN